MSDSSPTAPTGLKSPISHVIFDFDGTLSWLRHGWPNLMYSIFRGHWPVQPGEGEEDVREALMSNILGLNGKPTIFQMNTFVERVQGRGARCPTASALFEQYQTALDIEISARSRQVAGEASGTDTFVIHGARVLLEKLQGQGLTLIILSGTIEHRVQEEAALLDLARYFGNHIYGSTPDPAHFSKQNVIERLLREEGIEGKHLLSFGDGPVEIESTRAIGGLAIGVASDEEHNGSGKTDVWKERELRAAGAQHIIADYRAPDALLDWVQRRAATV